MTSCRDAYLDGRGELGKAALALLGDVPDGRRILSHVFWENLWCDEAGVCHTLFYDQTPGRKTNVQSFDAPGVPEITRRDKWLRLAVTANWALDLEKYGSPENWFNALSTKTRKKLRWLRNALPREGVSVVPVDSEARFRQFEALYAAQFPKHPLNSAGNNGVWKIYEWFQAQGRNFSFLLLDSGGEAVAANLGYINNGSFNFTHLTRKSSSLDKFSPGFYLTWKIVQMLYEERPQVKFFFMGPGKFDYKVAFMAEPMPVYRYVRNSLWNLPELIRLRFRLRKELKKRE